MKTTDFYIKPNAKTLNESLSRKFGEKLDIDGYSTEQLKKAAGLIESKINTIKHGKFNEALESEEFHRLKLMHDVVRAALSERAVSKSQQQAAGAALAAKRGDAPKSKLKDASKEMMKMSTKELEKFAGTKHKGLPKKVDEVSKKKNDGNLANNAKPYDKVTRGDVIAGRLGKDEMGGKKKMTKESYIAIGRYLAEGEEGKAELIMAVKDMVDKFTGWSEDIAQMQAQTAMEMADAIRDEMGSDAAEQFTAGIQPALDAAFQAVKSAREALNNQVGTLTGNAPEPMGPEPEADVGGEELPATGDEELPPEPEADETPPEGREKRESIERRNRLTKLLVSR